MKINSIGQLVKANPIQTQSNPVLSAVEWANLQKAKMNISYVKTTNYDQTTMNYAYKKQTQFKPNQTQFKKGQNEYKLNSNKGLQKKR